MIDVSSAWLRMWKAELNGEPMRHSEDEIEEDVAAVGSSVRKTVEASTLILELSKNCLIEMIELAADVVVVVVVVAAAVVIVAANVAAAVVVVEFASMPTLG